VLSVQTSKCPKRHRIDDELGTVSRLGNSITEGKSNLVKGPANQCRRLEANRGLICPWLDRAVHRVPVHYALCVSALPQLVSVVW